MKKQRLFNVKTTQNSYLNFLVSAKDEHDALKKLIFHSSDFTHIDFRKVFKIKIKELK